jgi:aconitate hydratase
VAGPRRPQDRTGLAGVRGRFREALGAPPGPASSPARHPAREVGPPQLAASRAVPAVELSLADGDVVIAAITSCTNTSNPTVMLAAGLLARKARARGLAPRPWVKTSLAPGSRVVTDYLSRTGLQEDLDALGFHTVGYGCTTCIGNAGPLDPRLEELVRDHDLTVASVLSGNRNFEARIHPAVRANFLMSPPLVVAYALAGTVDVDLASQPLGRDRDGVPVFLRDLWPSGDEVDALLGEAVAPERTRANYAGVAAGSPEWQALAVPGGATYAWSDASTYVREAPWFEGIAAEPARVPPLRSARALLVLGDSVTTDHISPAGAIAAGSPAGLHLSSRGVSVADFNSYGARRGNHEVMVRGTFANVRIRNLLVPGVEGGVTIHQPSGERLPVYDAARRYASEGVPLLVMAGREYGTGSSRDWAAKGTRLLGVRAVVARSFERIHRANLAGMGVLPLELSTPAEALALDGTENYDLEGVEGAPRPRQPAVLVVRRREGAALRLPVVVRIDTALEEEAFRNGGLLPHVLRRIARGG